MNYLSYFFLLSFTQYALAAPIIVTRVHTADAVTSIDTYTTLTNTVTAPTVEILVSDGVTYTYTLTDATFAEPTTFTSFVNKDAVTTTSAAGVADAATTTPAAITTTLTPSTTDAAITSTPVITTDAATTEAATTATTPATTEAATTDAATTEATTEATTDATTDAATTAATTEATTTEAAQTTTAATTPTSQQNAVSTTDSVINVSEVVSLQAPTAIATSIATGSASATVVPKASTATTAATTTATAAATSSAVSVPSAIVYSPYNDDGTCKDSSTVYTDLQLIKSTGINKIRVYGTDCNSLYTVENNAASLGLTVNQGFWISEDGVDSIDDAVTALIEFAQNDSTNGWAVFDFITIGNEAVQSGYATVDELISKISSVKAQLKAAGYTGKVTTSEPPVVFETYPRLCTSSEVDFIGINPHAYFDTSSSAETAGTFVKGQLAIVQEICGDIDILVTETGYPSAGIQNGGNIPSVANQKIAIANILNEMDNEVTILSTYNDYWKSPGAYGIEQSFGVIQLFE